MEMRFRFDIMRDSPFINAGSVKKQAKDDLNKLAQTFIRHLDRIKVVYKYCETIAEGPLWTFSGGGMQLQQFYGDDNGYICILYLDMEDDDKNTGKKESFTLVIQDKKLKSKFKDFKYERIKVELY